MQTELSKDSIPVSDFGTDPSKIISRTQNTHQPILLTNHGRGVAVVQGVEEFEKDQEEREFIRAVAQGLMDIKVGNELELDEVKKKLGLD